MEKRFQTIFFIGLLLAILTLVFFVFLPYLTTLFLAGVFAVIFRPVYKKILKFLKGREFLAGLATVFLAAVVLTLPLIFFSVQIFNEASRLFSSLSEGSGFLNAVAGDLETRLSNLGVNVSINLPQYAKQILNLFIQNIGALFSGLARFAVDFFILLFALYYLLKDGDSFKEKLVKLIPLPDKHNEEILAKMEKAVSSVIRGSVLIALVQGTLIGAGFALFKVPNPVLWGGVGAMAALIPGIGTALVLVPAVVYLFIFSTAGAALGLAVWGGILVGLVDNILKPKLIERGIQIHPLIILLSVFGGISLFGPLGFIIGPVIASLFFALLDIYTLLMEKLA